MKRKISLFATLILVASFAVSADVTFNTTDGTGFVGKGDVQTAFDWNNAALQMNAAGVTFKYSSVTEYDAVCMWVTGPEHNRRTHRVTHSEEAGVNTSIAVDTRKNSQGQVTGFKLLGYTNPPVSSGEIPVVGGPCQGNEGHGGTWESVEQVGTSGGGLYVSFGGTGVLLD